VLLVRVVDLVGCLEQVELRLVGVSQQQVGVVKRQQWVQQ
jgi:hypothetical protein